MTVAGLAPVGVLFGFGVFLISTGLFYGLPLPVQPMKAVSAVILTDGLRPGEVAAAGMMLGLVLLGLGISGWIGRHLNTSNPRVRRSPVPDPGTSALRWFLP